MFKTSIKMSQYKVGDVAALFSKPKEPTTETGKKLQSLFKEFHCNIKKTSSQIIEKEVDKDQGSEKAQNQSRVPKKEKKRKFSAASGAESYEINNNLKKFKKVRKQEGDNSTKQNENNFPAEQDFPRKKKSKTNRNSLNNGFNSVDADETAFSDDNQEVPNANFKSKRKFNVSIKKQVSSFLRKSKQQRQVANNGINKKKDSQVMLDEDGCTNDTLFKESNEEFVEKNVKKQKKKRYSDDNFVQNTQSNHTDRNNGVENKTSFKKSYGNSHKQNLQQSISKKGEPDFIKVPDLKSEEEDEDKLSRTLFVGNLPVNINKKAVRTLFSPFGEIQQIRYHGIETDKAKIFSENGSQTLNANNYAADSVPGFIVFCSRESAVKALSLSGSLFKGRHITVDFALPSGTKKIYDEKRSVFIGNLPFECHDESIWEAFSECGRIENVRIVRDKKTGIGKGFGYVQFSTVQSKENALALEDLNIQGRSIRIKPVDSNQSNQKKGPVKNPRPVKSNTFKSRAIRIKMKNKDLPSRKSVKKIMKKQKNLHLKKKTASILQKSMKM